MNTFHEGERAVQKRLGVQGPAGRVAAAIDEVIPAGARPFLASLTTIAAGAIGDQGQPWATLWVGRPGVISAGAGGREVTIARSHLALSPDDPVHPHLHVGGPVALVGIDFATRRRLRINGQVQAIDEGELVVRTQEAFGNCPKYIQRRQMTGEHTLPSAASRDRTRTGSDIDAAGRALLGRADTAFVASLHPARGLDVSHRGGPPGFIRVHDERTLLIPDYSGNNMFQTLGNLTVEPRAGLTVVDFDNSRLLAMTGRAAISYAGGDKAGTGGTGRFWRFSVEAWIEFDLAGGAHWVLVDRSQYNPDETMTDETGEGRQAAR